MLFSSLLLPARQFSISFFRSVSTVNHLVKHGIPPRVKKIKSPALDGAPQKKGVCLKLFAVKPRKPNSAQRKCAKVKMSNGKVVTCYIPGEGHNLQEHSVVLVRGGKVQDCPSVNYKIIRGALDCQGVLGRMNGRSKVGTKKPKTT